MTGRGIALALPASAHIPRVQTSVGETSPSARLGNKHTDANTEALAGVHGMPPMDVLTQKPLTYIQMHTETQTFYIHPKIYIHFCIGIHTETQIPYMHLNVYINSHIFIQFIQKRKPLGYIQMYTYTYTVRNSRANAHRGTRLYISSDTF